MRFIMNNFLVNFKIDRNGTFILPFILPVYLKKKRLCKYNVVKSLFLISVEL